MSQSFQTTRKVALERANGECAFCGVTTEQHRQDTGRGLDVHHVLPRSAGGSNKPSNLIAVCRGCHKMLEHSQAAAMKEIREENENGKDELRQNVIDLKDRNGELHGIIDGLLKRVHELERRNRSVEYYKKILSPLSVDAEVVSENIGTRVYATTNPENARDDYEEWGSAIKRTRLSVEGSDISRNFDRLQEQLERVEKWGYDD